MAPKMRPPGNRKRISANADAVDTTTMIAISGSEDRPAGPRALGRAGATSPNSASPAGNADGQKQHAHGLHDGDRAQVGPELRRKRNHLNHRARARAHQRGKRVPVVHGAQIACGRHDHGDRRDDEQRNACRPGEKAPDSLRRHHRAELYADNDVANARQRDRHLDGTAEQSGGADRQHRAGDKAGR